MQVRVSQQLPTALDIPYSHPRLNAGQQGSHDDDDIFDDDGSDFDCDDNDFDCDDSDFDCDDSDLDCDCSDFDCDCSEFDCDCSHRFIGTQKLSEMLQQPYDLFKPGWADHYILGMVNQVNIWMGITRNQA